jgi:hypothetical protein
MRWPIETGFEDGKHDLGIGDYEAPSWLGWHHHMTLVILAHFFLVRLWLSLRKAPDLTLPQVQVLLLGVLPKREFDAQMALDLVDYWQRRNQAAHVAHRKRRIAQLSRRGKVSL